MIYMFILLCLADLSLSLACSFRMDSLCGLLVGSLTPPSASLSNVDWAGPVQPHTPHIHTYTHTHTPVDGRGQLSQYLTKMGKINASLWSCE